MPLDELDAVVTPLPPAPVITDVPDSWERRTSLFGDAEP